MSKSGRKRKFTNVDFAFCSLNGCYVELRMRCRLIGLTWQNLENYLVKFDILDDRQKFLFSKFVNNYSEKVRFFQMRSFWQENENDYKYLMEWYWLFRRIVMWIDLYFI